MGLISRVSSRTYRNTHTLDTATMVNVPKARKTYCPATRKHQNFKVTQYKKVKNLHSAKVDDDITENKAVMVVRPNRSSTKKPYHQKDCVEDGDHLRQGQEEVRHHETNQTMQVLRARW